MFPSGVGFGELIVIGIVLLLVVGPKKLPDVAKDVGKGLKTIRKVTNQLRDSAEVDEIKRAVYGEPGHTPAWKRSVSEHLNGLMEDDEPAGRHMAPTVPPPRTAGAVVEGEAVADHVHDHDHDHDDDPDHGRPVARAAGPAAAAAAAEAALVAVKPATAESPPTAVAAAPATLPAASPGNGPTNGEQSA